LWSGELWFLWQRSITGARGEKGKTQKDVEGGKIVNGRASCVSPRVMLARGPKQWDMMRSIGILLFRKDTEGNRWPAYVL
jgi:hypothetical protein